MNGAMSVHVALKGPSIYACQRLLIGHYQTCRGRALTAEFDPLRTSWPRRAGSKASVVLNHLGGATGKYSRIFARS